MADLIAASVRPGTVPMILFAMKKGAKAMRIPMGSPWRSMTREPYTRVSAAAPLQG